MHVHICRWSNVNAAVCNVLGVHCDVELPADAYQIHCRVAQQPPVQRWQQRQARDLIQQQVRARQLSSRLH